METASNISERSEDVKHELHLANIRIRKLRTALERVQHALVVMKELYIPGEDSRIAIGALAFIADHALKKDEEDGRH